MTYLRTPVTARLLAVLALGLISEPSSAQVTPPRTCEKATTVFYANGVWNSYGAATLSLDRTRRLYLEAAEPTAGEVVQFDLAFNPSAGSRADVVEAIQQRLAPIGAATVTQILDWINGLVEPPVWAQSILVEAYARAVGVPARAPVVFDHVQRYSAAIAGGERVIVIAHSQGNLFTNEAYGQLTATERALFRTIPVATPATATAGGAVHVTAEEDAVINWLAAGALRANVVQGNRIGDWSGHAFIEFYARQGSATRAAIKARMVAASTQVPFVGIGNESCVEEEPPPLPLRGFVTVYEILGSFSSGGRTAITRNQTVTVAGTANDSTTASSEVRSQILAVSPYITADPARLVMCRDQFGTWGAKTFTTEVKQELACGTTTRTVGIRLRADGTISATDKFVSSRSCSIAPGTFATSASEVAASSEETGIDIDMRDGSSAARYEASSSRTETYSLITGGTLLRTTIGSAEGQASFPPVGPSAAFPASANVRVVNSTVSGVPGECR